jgi:hypothetical protein
MRIDIFFFRKYQQTAVGKGNIMKKEKKIFFF